MVFSFDFKIPHVPVSLTSKIMEDIYFIHVLQQENITINIRKTFYPGGKNL